MRNNIIQSEVYRNAEMKVKARFLCRRVKTAQECHLRGGEHALPAELSLTHLHSQKQKPLPTVYTHIRLLLSESGNAQKT